MAFPRDDPQVDLPRGNSLSNPTPPGLRPPPPPRGVGEVRGDIRWKAVLRGVIQERCSRREQLGVRGYPGPGPSPGLSLYSGPWWLFAPGEGPTGRGACLPPLSHPVAILVTSHPRFALLPRSSQGRGQCMGICDRPKGGSSITEGAQAGGNPCLGQVSEYQRCE